MKKYLVLLLTCIPFVAHSAWIDSSGKPIADSESMRSVDDFGVQIVLTADEPKFRQKWNTSKTPPKLSTTNTVRLGGSISAVLIFHGCTPNAAGVCDVASEFILESPDGNKMPAASGPVWSDKPMPQKVLQLGLSSMTIGFNKTDLTGKYNIIANIKDNISGKTLKVVTHLKVKK
ncbi:MAG: hypothetical protein WBP13_10140 [Methylophilaceae bacterium]